MTVLDLGAKRREKATDATQWTGLDAIEEALKDIKAGKAPMPHMAFIAMIGEPNENGMSELHYYAGGGKQQELIGLLQLHIHRLCRDE